MPILYKDLEHKRLLWKKSYNWNLFHLLHHAEMLAERKRTWFLNFTRSVFHPKNVVLLIGTNDIGRGLPLSMTIDNVSKIIETTKNACPDVNFVLQAVYPINQGIRDRFEKRSNEKIDLMNKEFIKISEKYNCVWLDITDKLKDETGNLKKEYTFDGLHLNISAYKIVAENIIPLLK